VEVSHGREESYSRTRERLSGATSALHHAFRSLGCARKWQRQEEASPNACYSNGSLDAPCSSNRGLNTAAELHDPGDVLAESGARRASDSSPAMLAGPLPKALWDGEGGMEASEPIKQCQKTDWPSLASEDEVYGEKGGPLVACTSS
jgi:hypothetical protein